MSRQLVVYTAVYGSNPAEGLRLQDPAVMRDGVDYVCFTDQPSLRSACWRVRRDPVVTEDPRMAARRRKILAHEQFPDHDMWLWLDSRFQLLADPLELAKDLLAAWDQDCVALRHPDRSNLQAEADEIIERGKAPSAAIEKQVAHYVGALGFGDARMPALTATGFILRRNTSRARAFNTTWWSELVKWGHPRDQMSVDFAAREVGLRVQYACGDYRDNPYAKWSRIRAAVA